MGTIHKKHRFFAFMLALAMIFSSSVFTLSVAGGVETDNPDSSKNTTINWKLLHNESFEEEFAPPKEWAIDDYTQQDDIFFGENGYGVQELWRQVGGKDGLSTFYNELTSFTSFRQSYYYGETELVDGKEVPWLTVETYGRGESGATEPSSGGQAVLSPTGGAQLICDKHTDAVMLRSTNPLPNTYRLEITVKDMNLGGKNYDENYWEDPHWTQEAWTSNGKMNGYDEKTALDLKAGPWRPSGDKLNPDDPFAPAYDQNGGYFLSIVDYPDPKPHNNLFLHHHRKVAMDFDNNVDFIDGWGGPWSKVWNGTKYVDDGSRYISMLWANGNHPNIPDKHTFLQYLQTGQKFYTFTPDEEQTPRINTVEMVDKYIPGEEYTFAIERTKDYYEMSVTGNFFYGGQTTYSHRKAHLPSPDNGNTVTWHFNQTTDELNGYTPPNDKFTLMDKTLETWPKDATYPDYFFAGMPHINYYSGSMTFTNIKLYVPA